MKLDRIRPSLLAATLLASSSALAEGSYPPPPTTPPPPGSSAPSPATPPNTATPAPGTTPPAATPGVTAPSGAGALPPATGAAAAGSSAQKPPADDTAILLVVPASTASDPTLANGCWARLYDRTNFRGELLPIAGNVSIADTHATLVAGYELGRNFDSLMLGAHASLSVWDATNYRNRKTIFGPGEAITDLDLRMSDMEDIRSIKLTCTP